MRSRQPGFFPRARRFAVAISVATVLSSAVDATIVWAQPPTVGTSRSQQIKLTVADTRGVELLGANVSIDGDTAIVGAHHGAYIFQRTGGATHPWVEVATLVGEGTFPGDCGAGVAVSGDTAIIVCPSDNGDSAGGSVFVFSRHEGGPNAWGQVTQLFPHDAGLVGSASIDGDTIIVGAWTTDEVRGSAYVFTRPHSGANAWSEVTKLTASDGDQHDAFGWSVSISGDIAVVGAQNDEHPILSAGSAYIFSRNKGGMNMWGEVTKLTASDADVNDRFGWSVAIGGDTVIVGAPQDRSESGLAAGAAYIFSRNEGGPNAWGEVAKLTASDGGGEAFLGRSVSISGNTAMAGAAAKRVGSGAAYVFSRDAGGVNAWGEIGRLTAIDGRTYGAFGSGVSVSGDTVLVGASQVFNGSAYACQFDPVMQFDGCRRVEESLLVVNSQVGLNVRRTSCCANSEFIITATLQNFSDTTIPMVPMRQPFFEVTALTTGNVLANADGGPGGVGATLTPDVGADGVLAPGESIRVTFVIRLATRDRFRFEVNVLGHVDE